MGPLLLDPQLEAAFEAAYKRGIKKRMPYFFTTLENRLEFTAEELAFIRSDEPLYADGNISDFVAQLKRQYKKSGSALDYEMWIRQSWLPSRTCAASVTAAWSRKP